jgi:hypothetical protein
MGINTATADWLRVTSVTATSTATFSPPGLPTGPLGGGTEELWTSPVLGDGNEMYAVTKRGRFYVFATSTSGAVVPNWFDDLVGAGIDVVAHPNLDCNRSRPGTANMPGVLYSVSRQGWVNAIVVDSQKLSTSSPWPRWQRTASNAGNLDGANFALNPGCD